MPNISFESPMSPKHSFAFFGTPEVARETLEVLLGRGFLPALVVTSPDAPKGRGLTLTPSPMKVAALEHAISVLTPEKLDDESVAAIGAQGCDYAVVVAYGKIFPEQLITAFPKGVLNIHYSLLPKYRGATPLEGALLAGEPETGVTIQKMARELDAGDVLAQESIAIAPEETARELRPRLISMGATLLADTLPAFVRGELVPAPQNAALASHTRKLKKEDGLVSLDAPTEENWNKYRAYADTIGTYFFENGKRMKITKASFKDGRFIVERVIPEGKREMAYEATRRNEKGQ
ncbi:MAG: methionyl-tRNA formyltransferase [Patescibacteria group bacterium]|nr:methionyl-tRNA formyltransferase [Patescibacteria group bacterium]